MHIPLNAPGITLTNTDYFKLLKLYKNSVVWQPTLSQNFNVRNILLGVWMRCAVSIVILTTFK
jgi:hypothetical protein